MIVTAASAAALLVWLVVLRLPSRPHRTRERLEPGPASGELAAVTVLIPARNEAALIEHTLAALRRQGPGLEVLVIDDESTDGTADACRRFAQAPAREPGHGVALRVIRGAPLPPGWAGKLWALQQGLEQAEREFVLLLDADVEVAPNLLPALLRHARAARADAVSIMAELHCAHFWERLLVPAFVFFFKLLYPFALVNSRRRRNAAAAGGCMLIRSAALRDVGGFEAVRGALIDDCAMAAELKRRHYSIWLGLSRSVRSLRAYPRLGDFWSMVSRTAYTQLRYSPVLLVFVSLVMLAVFAAPPAALASARSLAAVAAGGGALLAMGAAYLPVVRFYRLPALWALTLPFAALLFLGMTWGSAINYWSGTRATWKSRSYDVVED